SVDQTTAEHRAEGFSCAKVIVPGLVPMTFGHDYRRLTGLPRLLTVPRVLGHRERDLTPEELNPHPHPFPCRPRGDRCPTPTPVSVPSTGGSASMTGTNSSPAELGPKEAPTNHR